eukprot:scaffold9266_cov104-Amphora_coffeaeformis.AAC.1
MNCMMRPEKILQVGLLFVSLAIIHVIVPFTGLHQDGIFQMRVGTQVKLSGGYQLLWLELAALAAPPINFDIYCIIVKEQQMRLVMVWVAPDVFIRLRLRMADASHPIRFDIISSIGFTIKIAHCEPNRSYMTTIAGYPYHTIPISLLADLGSLWYPGNFDYGSGAFSPVPSSSFFWKFT